MSHKFGAKVAGDGIRPNPLGEKFGHQARSVSAFARFCIHRDHGADAGPVVEEDDIALAEPVIGGF